MHALEPLSIIGRFSQTAVEQSHQATREWYSLLTFLAMALTNLTIYHPLEQRNQAIKLLLNELTLWAAKEKLKKVIHEDELRKVQAGEIASEDAREEVFTDELEQESRQVILRGLCTRNPYQMLSRIKAYLSTRY
jgi:hypothetical protein